MIDNPPVIDFRHVTIDFDGRHALDDVSFTLERGGMICFTGISGSGKSVLLRVAAGLLMPDAGEVLVDGCDIARLSEPELLALRSKSMGVLFQEQSVFTGMSVYDNAAYRLNENGLSDEETDRAVNEILRFVGLDEELDKFPEELSVGMCRRLEFARALVGWPKIMLLDEASAGLDPLNARAMLDLVIRARDIHQISTLFVTKELREIPYLNTHSAVKSMTGEIFIESMASGSQRQATDAARQMRVMVLDNGSAVFFGSVAEFASSVLPQVTLLTHPPSSAPPTDTYIPDPWARRAKK